MAIVQTVLGTVSPNILGRTLTHEHLALSIDDFYLPPPEELKEFLDKEITLENLGMIRQYPYSNRYNMKFYDEDTQEALRKDLQLFKKFDGGTIVENSCHGLKRNLGFLYEISKETGVHVIAGTGHYVHLSQPSEIISGMDVEKMTDLYSKEILTGCKIDGKEPIKCGFIGEVGTSWPIAGFERRAILATGEIQEVLGCGVSFHPAFNSKAPFEILRQYLEAGGKAEKCVMSHLDITIPDIDELLEFSKFGTYLQYDLFGIECSHFQFDPDIDVPSDAQRINNLIRLLNEGLEDRLLISHDIHAKHRLVSFGGHGFSHIYVNVLPKLYAKGATFAQVEKLTVHNPADWLAFKI